MKRASSVACRGCIGLRCSICLGDLSVRRCLGQYVGRECLSCKAEVYGEMEQVVEVMGTLPKGYLWITDGVKL